RRHGIVGAGRRRRCSSGHDPEFNLQLWHTATIDCYQSAGVDTARIDQIVLGAIGACLCFTLASSIGNDVALRTWLVLQLDGVVVESGLFIVELDVAILVKLHRWLRWRLN